MDPVTQVLMLLVAAVAAAIDLRTGRIPNWLTLPAAATGPLVWLMVGSPGAAAVAVAAIVVCGLPPYIMFRIGGLGGGDVKLFAALGGLGGPTLGLELQMYSLVVALVLAIVVMAARGQLAALLANVGRLAARPFLPAARRRPVASMGMHSMRLGGAILVGTAIAVVQSHALG